MNTETEIGSRRKRTRTDDANGSERVSSPVAGVSASAAQAVQQQPKRVACIQCRQAKLRCDSPKNPCSRCERLDLPCSKDKGYKRVNKRSKIDDLEKALLQLQARVVDPPPVVPPPMPSTASLSVSRHSLPLSSGRNNITVVDPHFLSENLGVRGQETLLTPDTGPRALLPKSPIGEVCIRSPAVKARAIESIALGPYEIDALFDLYFNRFHPFFPLPNPAKSPDMYYERSQILFWVIISVASRRYSEDKTLQPNLAKTVMDFAWKVIADPPLNITSLQAILILCMWPPSNTHLWSDASTSLSNIAMVAAFHMGFHRPDHVREFNRNPRTGENMTMSEADKLERRKTWAACNIVSQYVTMNVGYPPTWSCFDWSIERACEAGNLHSVSDDLRFHLILQKSCYQTTKAMSDNIANPFGLPSPEQWNVVMNSQEQAMAILEGQLDGKLSAIDRIHLRSTRLYLEIFHWLGKVWTEEKRKGILKSYATSVAVINDFLSADASFQVLSYGPIPYPRVLFNAGYIVLRVLNSVLSIWVDIEAGIALFHSAVTCMRRYSCHENDITFRAATILNNVWDHRDEIFHGEKLGEPTLISRSRLGGSMTFDCLWRWKDKYPDQRVSNAPHRPVNACEREETAVTEAFDAISSTFDWALLDDFDWPWTIDGSANS